MNKWNIASCSKKTPTIHLCPVFPFYLDLALQIFHDLSIWCLKTWQHAAHCHFSCSNCCSKKPWNLHRLNIEALHLIDVFTAHQGWSTKALRHLTAGCILHASLTSFHESTGEPKGWTAETGRPGSRFFCLSIWVWLKVMPKGSHTLGVPKSIWIYYIYVYMCRYIHIYKYMYM